MQAESTAMPPEPSGGKPAGRLSRMRGRLILAALGGALIALVFVYALPKMSGYGTAWRRVEGMSTNWIAVLVVGALLNVLSNALPWMAALPGLGFLHALRVSLASSALSFIAPGGTAVSVATQVRMLKGWGVRGGAVALATTLVNVLGQLIAFGFPALAVAALMIEGGRNNDLELVALVGFISFVLIVGLFVAGMASAEVMQRLGGWVAGGVTWFKARFRRRPVLWGGEDFVRFRGEALGLLRRRGSVLTVTTLLSQFAVYLILVLSLRAVGVSNSTVPLVESFAAWSLVRALGKIPLTPGGFGVEEVVLAGALIGFGATNAQAVSATLLYRFLTIAPVVALGLVSVATYRIGIRRLEHGHGHGEVAGLPEPEPRQEEAVG